MKVAAIYARKSTGQNVAEDAKSVTRQVENAKAFAIAQGWSVDDQFVFIDDGISGADTRRLRAKQQLLASVGQFDVVVMQAQDRFSRRDGDEAFGELQALSRHVEVWFYAERSRFDHGTLASNVTGFLRAEFAAEFRRAIAQKTSEAMLRRAQQGHVTGGKVFGYDNVRRNGHVSREVNSPEAAVVREIYDRYADGEGFKQIAHALNARQVPRPRASRGRPSGWEPSTVRAVLKRSDYRGTAIYNRTKKRRDDGSRRGRQRNKPESEWVKIAVPRIIEPDVAERVDDRLETRRSAYLRDTMGRLLGRPRGTGFNRHLLAGFLVCECGARFEAVKQWRGTPSYVCSARRRKGPDVCPSEISFPVGEIDQAFLDVIEGAVLHPDFIERVVDAVFANNPDAERATMLDERRRLASDIENLTRAIASGGDIPALAAALAERDKRLKALDAKLAKPVVTPDRDTLHAALLLRGGQWRDVLRGPHIDQARLVLQHLIDVPIRIMNQPWPKHVKHGDTRGFGRRTRVRAACWSG